MNNYATGGHKPAGQVKNTQGYRSINTVAREVNEFPAVVDTDVLATVKIDQTLPTHGKRYGPVDSVIS